MLRKTAAVFVLAAASSIAACSSGVDAPPASVRTKEQPAVAQQPKAAAKPRIVVLGDSLTAGLGLPIEDAYPAVLQAMSGMMMTNAPRGGPPRQRRVIN